MEELAVLSLGGYLARLVTTSGDLGRSRILSLGKKLQLQSPSSSLMNPQYLGTLPLFSRIEALPRSNNHRPDLYAHHECKHALHSPLIRANTAYSSRPLTQGLCLRTCTFTFTLPAATCSRRSTAQRLQIPTLRRVHADLTRVGLTTT